MCSQRVVLTIVLTIAFAKNIVNSYNLHVDRSCATL